MSVIFKPQNHLYESLGPDKVDWISVTKFVSMFKEPFDPIKQSEKSSKNKKSKWYGIPPEKIREIWDTESKRADESGSWYHDEREVDLTSISSIRRNGVDIPIIKPIMDGVNKIAPVQSLTEGIYPEHFVYLKSARICGQSDRVEVVGDEVNITDYKTNKEIKTRGFTNWEGITKKMLPPLHHLDDCNLNHYTLQVSLYLYIILKHNPHLKPGKLELQHVTFQIEDTDKFGFPIIKKFGGKPVIDKITNYRIPYLRNEVREMIKHLQENE